MITESDLKRYRKIREEVKLLEYKITELENTMIVPGCQRITGMPGGGFGNNDQIADILARKEALKKSYLRKIGSLLELQEKIDKALDSLETTEKQIMTLYYCLGHTWSEVAARTGLSRRWVIKVQREIIKKLQKCT